MPIYRRPGSPHWWSRNSVAGVKTRRSTGTDNKPDALEFDHREAERLWRLHKLGDRSAVRWSEVGQRWLNETTKRTKAKDEAILEWLEPHIGSEPISAIDRDALEEIRNLMLDEGVAQSTVDRRMALVRAILRKCVDEWRCLDRAPKVPMFRPATPEPRWLTHEEWKRLKKELPEHLALAAQFAVLTGLRMRSMLALTWDRIDMQMQRLWVPGSQMKAGRTHGVPISDEAVSVLKKLRKLNPDGQHVFQWNGRPIDDCNTKAFQDALERAQIEGANWHSLRHTFASWAVQSGVTLQELMQLMGVSSYQIVLRYAHLAPDHLATAAQKVGTIRAHSKKSRKRKVA
jgi:integrase